MAFLIGILVITIVLLPIIAEWIIFTKAGRHGWATLIPIYSTIVSLQVAKMSPWNILWYIAFFLPVFPAISTIMRSKIATNFGKGDAFALGLIFLPFIFYPILAFGSAEYQFDEEDYE